MENENEIKNEEMNASDAEFDIQSAFFDARTAKEKIQILSEHENEITERMIGNIEASLDLPGGNGTLWQRIEYVMYCLRTKSRFETDRLR